MLLTRKLSTIFALSLLALAGTALFLTRDRFFPHADSSLALVRGYLAAVYARDFRTAYPLLAADDRQIRDEARYVASQGQYDGFTLEVSRKLAGFMKVWLIEQKESGGRLVLKVGYRVPAPAELNDLLLKWDQDRLNSLSKEKQNELLAEVDSRNKSGKLLNIEGQETIELIEEPEGWKIFLDWVAGTRVLLHSRHSYGGKLEVRFAAAEVMAKNDELFMVNVKIRNPRPHALTFSVKHLLEPPAAAEDLQLVECGLLVPITLEPQQEKEFAMGYLLNASAGRSYREVKLTYEFKLQ
ncbi:MAG: hypothetical protein ACXWW4_15130 [Candidatus Binatia bacterium]